MKIETKLIKHYTFSCEQKEKASLKEKVKNYFDSIGVEARIGQMKHNGDPTVKAKCEASVIIDNSELKKD